MLGDISIADKIFIVCGYTDMRKSIDGLCSLIQDKLHLNPCDRSLYLFCGKRCDRIKLLIYKRLSVTSGRYRWPRNRDEVKSLSWKEFDWLVSGLDIEQPKAIKTSV